MGRLIGFHAVVVAVGLAAVAMSAHDPQAAALLLGRAKEVNVFVPPEVLRNRVRDALGDVGYGRLLAEGAQLTDEELFALALGLDAQ